jgi:hypothetical protein
VNYATRVGSIGETKIFTWVIIFVNGTERISEFANDKMW